MSDPPNQFHAEVIQELPFVTETAGGGMTFWDVEASGHQDTDVELGAWYARLAISVSREFDMPALVAMCLRDMIAAGHFTAVEAGFISQVTGAANAGSLN